jgi:hypothetical protein
VKLTVGVVQAIAWAIQMRVHVISMSWTIPGECLPLQKAVFKAKEAGILMFGSASDQGANSTDLPFMAKLSKKTGDGPVICIGGARETGYADDKARDEAEFFFPGQTHGIPGKLPQMRSNFGSTIGSSVATALAAGLAALMMRLVDLSTKYTGYRQRLQNPDNIRKIFHDLLFVPSRERGESRTDQVILVQKYFKAPSRRQLILGDPGGKDSVGKNARAALDSVLERILR